MPVRSLEELTSVADPAWPELAERVRCAQGARLLPVDPERGRTVLHTLQVSAGSWLGALALNCGGLLADHGWFRILGGGTESSADLASVNGLTEPALTPGMLARLVVAHDALGGRFAIGSGGPVLGPLEVSYFGPDSPSWEGLGITHSQFVAAALAGDPSDAFATLRWPGWQEEVGPLAFDEGIACVPFPFMREGRDIGRSRRRAVPVTELFALHDELAARLDGLEDGVTVQVTLSD